jgi:hypothetical protein
MKKILAFASAVEGQPDLLRKRTITVNDDA